MNKIKNYIGKIMICCSILSPFYAVGQDVIEIDPLFQYPSAPEELSSIHEKSDYLVDHFWDQMDFKSKNAVDQNALNDAFKVYSVPMRWANKERSIASVDKLLEKISKNPTLLIQFTKAAEENLFSPRAEVWIDEVYLKFLNEIVKNKKIPESRKKHYQDQLDILQNTYLGAEAPEFKFTDFEGKEQTYFPMSTTTMIIFGDPSMTDWRIARLRMETNIELTQAVEKGKINVLFIVPKKLDDWQNEVSNYPATWTLGIAPDVGKIYDFRAVPSIYVIDSDKKIILKNVTPEMAIEEMLKRVKN